MVFDIDYQLFVQPLEYFYLQKNIFKNPAPLLHITTSQRISKKTPAIVARK
jgi:hypothetical protein